MFITDRKTENMQIIEKQVDMQKKVLRMEKQICKQILQSFIFIYTCLFILS